MHYFLCGAYTVFRVYKSDISQEPWFKSSFPMKNQHGVLDITWPPFKTFKTKWIVWNRKISLEFQTTELLCCFFLLESGTFCSPWGYDLLLDNEKLMFFQNDEYVLNFISPLISEDVVVFMNVFKNPFLFICICPELRVLHQCSTFKLAKELGIFLPLRIYDTPLKGLLEVPKITCILL